MKKNDLKNGAIIETRDGDLSILLFDSYVNEVDVTESILVSLKDGNFLPFSDYEEDLKFCGDSDFDIMKVAQSDYVGDDIRNHVLKRNENDWTWIRDESETVMTISEIEEKLGISNLKIKKED